MRNWQHIRALGSAGRVAVLGLGRDTERPACPGLSVWRTSSDPTFAAATQSGPTTMLSWLRDSTGHPSDRWFSPVASAELIDLVHEAEADVIVVGSSWLHGYIPALREAGCRVVLDMQNLEGPLHAELADARGDRLSAIFAERTLAIEARAIQSVDQVWVCSDHDAHAARDTYPSAAPIAVVPNTIEVERYGAIERSYGRMTLVYPGAFEYPPNRLAAGRLIEEIFPALTRVRRDARLALVGSGPTEEMRDAARRDPRIEVTGRVDDTLPYLGDATAMPIPLHEGGGTRLKALEAIAAGLPVVSTAKGVEGLDLVAGEHYLAAETAAEFVDAAVALFDDDRLRTGLAARAIPIVRERYSYPVARDSVYRALTQLGLTPSAA